MYSYADRLRAVQLYIKLGKRVGATIRELGYPTTNALKDWYREYERHHDSPADYVRTKRWYSDEQKRVAVERALRSRDYEVAGLPLPCKALDLDR